MTVSQINLNAHFYRSIIFLLVMMDAELLAKLVDEVSHYTSQCVQGSQ